MSKPRTASIIYLIGIHLLLAVVLAKSNFIPKLRAKFSPQPVSEFSEHFHRMSRSHAWMDGHIPDGSIFFIGDSITQALCVSAVAPNSVNLGIDGDTSLGIINRIPSLPSLRRASLIVIAIGINDLAKRGNDEVIRNCRRILELLPAHIPVIISSVLPVEEHFHQNWDKWNEERIRPLNRQLEQLALDHQHVTFSDSHSDMLDQRGQLRAALHVGDGIHLSVEGYSILIQRLKQAINA